jgi:hypothetical protein
MFSVSENRPIDDHDADNSDNNSVKFFIIHVPSQQLQCQLQTRRNVDTLWTNTT